MKTNRSLCRPFAILLFASLLLSSFDAFATLRMGFVGGRNPADCVRQWAPFIDYLSEEIGEPVEMVIREDYEGLIEALRDGELDLFEGGAFSHVAAMETGLADILTGEIRDEKSTYTSVFIVRRDDPAVTLGDLKNRRLALTDEYSTSGYLLPRVILARGGVKNPSSFFKEVVLTGSHDRSIEAVLEGTVDAAAVGDFFIKLLPKGKGDALKVIASSEGIPVGPITMRKDLSPNLLERVRKALDGYETRLSEERRRITEVNRFVPQKASDFDVVRDYYRESKALPKLAYASPYYRVSAVLTDRIAAAKRQALRGIIVSYLLLFIVLGAAWIKLRGRISASVGVSTASVVAVLSAIFSLLHGAALFSSMDALGARRLGELQNMSLRTVAAAREPSAAVLGGIIATAIDDGSISWARFFRNGVIIASNDPAEVGDRIADRVRAGTLEPAGEDVVPVIDPIFKSGRRFATLQVGIPFAPVKAAVIRAVATNAAAMLATMVIGMLAAFLVHRRLATPMCELSDAVNRLREGEAPPLPDIDAEVAGVAKNIARLGIELAEKESLVDLKASDGGTSDDSWNPEVTRELSARIRAIEEGSHAFRRLRKTEALGKSPAWLRTLRDAAIRARDRAPVVVIGPTGSGKTGVARVMHALGPRADKPFGEFNCAEFVSGDPLVVLGRLFGYGSDCGITGIDRRGQKGILEEFNDGTLFFDEVALLTPHAQQLLLLPLEGRPFNPAAGKGAPLSVNVRFIFASNERLEDLVHSGRMRADFLRRILARGSVDVPPLARRRQDIELLANHFLQRRNSSSERKLIFSQRTLELLSAHGYDHYNVSELAGTVDQAFDNALFDGASEISPRHLSSGFLVSVGGPPNENVGEQRPFDPEEEEELAALRRCGFSIAKAERSLGYAEGAKTLTNRLRGIAYRALERNNWDADGAVAEIAGSIADKAAAERLKSKMADYMATARRHLENDSTDKLFNNLPQKYHPFVEMLLAALRNGQL